MDKAVVWQQRIQRVLDGRKAWENKARASINLYRNTDQRDSIPLAHRTVKLLLAYLYYRDPEPIVIAEKDAIEVAGLEEFLKVDMRLVARAMERILSKARTQLSLRAVNRRIVLDMLLTDVGISKVSVVMRAGQPVVDVMRVSPFDFVYDEASLGILEDARWCAQRIFMPLVLVKQNKNYRNTEGLVGEWRLKRQEDTGENRYEKNDAEDDFERYVQLWEIYHREKDGVYITVLADESQPVILRHELYASPINDFPFVLGSLNPVTDSPYGIPLLWVLRGLHINLNKAMRQVLEKAGRQISAVALSEGLANKDDISNALEEDNGIGLLLRIKGTDVRNAVQPIDIGGIKPTDTALLQVILEMFHRVSGITQAHLSGVVMGRKTATEAEMIQQAATVTLSDLADDVEEFITRQFRLLAHQLWAAKEWEESSINFEWLPDDEYKAFRLAPPDAINMLKISIERGSAAILWHRQKAQEMQLILQVLSNPIVQQKMLQEGFRVNLAPVIERWLSYMGIRDITVVLQRGKGDEQGMDSSAENTVAQGALQELVGNLPMGWQEMGQGLGEGAGVEGAPILPEGGGGEGVL